MEQLWIGDLVGVVAEGAHPHRAEFLVAQGHRLRRAPALVEALAAAEVIDVALEGGLEQLVPVLQVGQQRQGVGAQLVTAGAEGVGDLALVDEHRELRLAHRQDCAGLDFAVLHRIAPGQHLVAVLEPFEYVDELFFDEVHQCHVGSFRNAASCREAQ